jgi:hypothetical protein
MKKKIFKQGTDETSFAYIGWQGKYESWYGLKSAYKNAADDFVDIVLEKGKSRDIEVLDTYFFPIVFLYRHSIEVSIKAIYFRYLGKILNCGHNLLILWDNLYKEVILELESAAFIDKVKSYKTGFRNYSFRDIDFDEIRRMLNEFNKYRDNKADVFRYLVDKNGESYIKDHQYLDYTNLKGNITHIYEVLDYIYFVTDEYLSG